MEDLPPTALLPIDITPYRVGNTGIDYVTTFTADAAGPHVAIVALIHGNEVAGAHALAFLFEQKIRPVRGKLTLAFANVAAYASFDPRRPGESRYLDEDMNRVWSRATLDGPARSRELARARALRPTIASVDFLLDLHSMQTASPPLVMCGTQAKGRTLARRVGVPATVVADPGHSAGPRLRDYGDFANKANPRASLLVECGQHWQHAARGVAIETCLRFLKCLEIVDASVVEPFLTDPPAPQRFVDVTEALVATTDNFTFVQDFVGLEVVPRRGTLIGHDGDKPIKTPYDDCVLIMPTRRLKLGQTAVRFGRFSDR
jgi:hypothetical protein